MENQVGENIQSQNQNSINQPTTPPVGSWRNYRLLLPILLVPLFLGTMVLLLVSSQNKKGQDQIGQPVGQPESTPSPSSQIPSEFTFASPSGKSVIIFKENRWAILYERKEYPLPLSPEAISFIRKEIESVFPLSQEASLERIIENLGKRVFYWSPNEDFLFAYFPFSTENPPKYVGKFMLVSLPPSSIETVWEKTLEAEDEFAGVYVFQGAIFSPSNKLYLTYEKSSSRTISVIDSSTQEKERIIKKETFERGFVSYWVPISVSPKESYLLILQLYEWMDEPLFLLNTKTGEFIDMQITINIENRDFVWSNDEKSVVFTYERVKDWDAPPDKFGYESGKVRYNLETSKLEYL